MPRKGFKSITIREEVYFSHKKYYEDNKTKFRKMGISSFSGYLTKLLYDSLEEEGKK